MQTSNTVIEEPKKETVEIENEVQQVVQPDAPTREALKAQGWSAKELESAEKRGMLAKPDDKKKEEEPKAEVKPEDKKLDPVKANGTLPDFTMTPEQEKVFTDTFGAGTVPRAMYFRMKNERQARQAAESRAKEFEARIKALEIKPAPKEQLVDENNQVVNPEDMPLTVKQLRELQKQEAEVYEKKQQEQTQRAQAVASAQRDQEEFAKTIHADFDDAVVMAKDVIQNLETLFPEKWKQTKAIKLIRDLQIAAAQADQLGLDEYNASTIVYEIGQLHPNYGKPPVKGEETGAPKGKDPKDGRLTPDQMKRMEENTQRRASSASVPDGGGKRVISVEDIDLAILNKMSASERFKFRDKHPDRYAKLLRG